MVPQAKNLMFFMSFFSIENTFLVQQHKKITCGALECYVGSKKHLKHNYVLNQNRRRRRRKSWNFGFRKKTAVAKKTLRFLGDFKINCGFWYCGSKILSITLLGRATPTPRPMQFVPDRQVGFSFRHAGSQIRYHGV